ncbi:MAG: helix-turn-helix transcriptional regulator [Deltaproteobacteria bacterium]|nr:helix-turn-helix transcriptional regulator [Deltaproteobacteria bacterium]
MAKSKKIRKNRTEIEERIRKRVRALRKDNKLTLSEVSQRSGLTIDAVGKIEGGRRTPSLSTLLKLARAFEVPPSELFSENEPELSATLRALVTLLDDKPIDVQQAALDIVRSLLTVINGKRIANNRIRGN